MGQVVISLAAMFASLTLFIAGTALLTTVVAVELASDGLTTTQVGLILGCHSVGFVFGSLFATRVVRGRTCPTLCLGTPNPTASRRGQ